MGRRPDNRGTHWIKQQKQDTEICTRGWLYGIDKAARYIEYYTTIIIPKLSDFLLDLRRSLAHKGFAKILDISAGMPAVFANPYASRSQHISSQKIAQLRL
ncbi:MAG: hypothetical protein K8R28_00270 [Desulfobacterales bacterium]|nr:hypothetical protein [Desulfobacterales bacterium]